MDQEVFYAESPFEELSRFRHFVSSPDDIEIPLRPEHRQKTDTIYTITFIAFVIALIPFLIYTLIYSDFRNLGYSDNCGNFCGFQNEAYDEWNCTGKDFTNKRFLLVETTPYGEYPLIQKKHCVENCNYKDYLSCKDNFEKSNAAYLEKAIKDVGKGSWIILLSVFISCLLCFGMFALFRYAVNFLVWFLISASIGLLFIGSAVCWHGSIQYKDVDRAKSKSMLTYSMILGGLGILLVLLLTCLYDRVKLIIELFKESAKAIFEIPGLTQLPLLTFMAVSLITIGFSVLFTFILTARKLVEVIPDYLEYKFDDFMVITIFYVIFIFVWVMQFLVGAQYMIIAGASSSWFFTRNKTYLDRPLWRSFLNFIKFHIGTAIIGSLIVSIVLIMRAILRALASNRRTRWIVECCCNEIIAFLKLFSKNAYIQTAMHGQPFFISGKRALHLLVSNAENVVAINSLGDFALGMAQVLLIILGGAIGTLIAMASGNPQADNISIICCILAAVIVIIFFGIFEATIDSIFMCFCEDTLLNDGMARPYYMTKGLHQFVENCKGVLPAKE